MSSLDSEAKPDNAGHSVLALTTSHSLVVSSPETFLPDMRKELGIIADLVESYNDELCLLKLMAVQFKTHNHQKLYSYLSGGNDSNLLIVFYVQIMPDDFVMQLHRF